MVAFLFYLLDNYFRKKCDLMKIYISADHKGVELKNEVINYLTNNGINVIDIGLKNYELDELCPIFKGSKQFNKILREK